jgi:hypothetical protein
VVLILSIAIQIYKASLDSCKLDKLEELLMQIPISISKTRIRMHNANNH